jgi:YebC/PmpR family DNA-binding regulatory protein
MSGHSKWSTIKHQKESQDKKRGLAFSKLAKAISIAAREGADPDSNFKLRLMVEKAKQINMPKANIERAIEKSSGTGEGNALEEILFEGYGPFGIAVMAEAVTDNRNRTASEIKSIFERSGGNLGGPGSVSFQFSLLGLIIIDNKDNKKEDHFLQLMDINGVEDLIFEKDAVEVYTDAQQLTKVKDEILAKGFEIKELRLSQKPNTLISITEGKKAENILEFVSLLENHDDIQNVYANFDIDEKVLKKQ